MNWFFLVSTLPLWYQLLLIIGLGVIIGSFLNVVIYRLHTGKSLNGSSHCLSCGTGLRWYELLPLVSYLWLRGRCRTCGSYIPARYLLVELLNAVGYIGLFLVFGWSFALLGWLALWSILLIVVVYDLYHLIIPNELVALTAAVAAGLQFHVFIGPGWWETVLWQLSGGVVCFMILGGLWWYSGGRWIGFGDAKLAIPLGFILGPLGSFSFFVFSFWIGAVVSVVLLLLQKTAARGQSPLHFGGQPITIKSEVPFAPFMVAAFWVVVLTELHALSLFSAFATL